MEHSGLKTSQNEWIFTAEAFIQHHGAVKPLTALHLDPLLTKVIRPIFPTIRNFE